MTEPAEFKYWREDGTLAWWLMSWTEEQLAKWRIRKMPAGVQPPWYRHRLAERIDGALQPLPDTPPWWVFPPGQTEPSGCWDTYAAAIHQVSDAICNQLVAPYRKDDE